jgi:hypothetical protein
MLHLIILYYHAFMLTLHMCTLVATGVILGGLEWNRKNPPHNTD